MYILVLTMNKKNSISLSKLLKNDVTLRLMIKMCF